MGTPLTATPHKSKFKIVEFLKSISICEENMAWGQELWDCYDQISSHVSSGVSTNLSTYSKFFKEKVEIEKEYAKGLRKLVSRYESRGEDNDGDGEKYDEELLFSTILTETGYIAGQHEMIAGTSHTTLSRNFKPSQR